MSNQRPGMPMDDRFRGMNDHGMDNHRMNQPQMHQPGYFNGNSDPGRNMNNPRMMPGGGHPPYYPPHQNPNDHYNFQMQGNQFGNQPMHSEPRFEHSGYEMHHNVDRPYLGGPLGVSNPHMHLRSPTPPPRTLVNASKSKLCLLTL